MAEEKKSCVFSVKSSKDRTDRLNQYAEDFNNGKKDMYSMLFSGYYAYLRSLEADVINAQEEEKDAKLAILKKAEEDGIQGYAKKEQEYLREALKVENRGKRESSYQGYLEDVRERLRTLETNEADEDAGINAQKEQGISQKAYADKLEDLDAKRQAGTLSEADYNTQKEAAKAAFDAELVVWKPVIEKGNKAVNEITNHNPRDVLDDLRTIADLPQATRESLETYRLQCIDGGEERKFNEVCREFLDPESKYQPSYETETITVEKDGKKQSKVVHKQEKDANGALKDIIKNEYRFERRPDKEGHPHHVVNIYNLDGTGLNISWIDGKLGFTALPERITEEQAKALAKYCYETGIEFENYKDLQNIPVVDNDKDKKSLKTTDENGEEKDKPASEYIKEEMARLRGEERDNETTGYTKEDGKGLPEGDMYQFLKYPSPDPNKGSLSKLEKSAKVTLGLMGFHTSKQIRINNYGNKTVISVYMNEDDMREDGKLDANRNRKRTKQFAVTFEAGPPACASIYMPPGKKMEADHARVALNALRDAGYKYVQIPGAVSSSKPMRGAFLTGCVKTGLVPVYIKNNKDTIIGEKDVSGIIEAMDKEKKDEPAKFLGNFAAEYYMRVAAQLERQKKDGESSKGLEKLKLLARFENFNLNYKSELMNFINEKHSKGIEAGGWDDADYIAAIRGMAKLVEDIQNGRVNGKAYNPIGNETENLIEALQVRMKEEKPKVIERISQTMQNSKSNEDKGDKDSTAKARPAVNAAYADAKEMLNKATSDVTNAGCEVKIEKLKNIGESFRIERYLDTKTYKVKEAAKIQPSRSEGR